MSRRALLAAIVAFGVTAASLAAETILFETTTAYSNIRVVDEDGMRILYFDSAPQSRMSLQDPLQGHYEYIDYLHMPWLWNDRIESVLVVGLGGASLQRTYQAYHPEVVVETVEIDPAVIEAAREYFDLEESGTMEVIASDGRQYLRRSTRKYDLIVLDAYTYNRYGSGIPYSLVTREFFQLVREHLSENGVVAYNVIGSAEAGPSGVAAALYATMRTSFSQVYLFPVETSVNVVMIAPASSEAVTRSELLRRADLLVRSGSAKLPGLRERAEKVVTTPPSGSSEALVLTDDFAPVDGLLKVQPRGATLNKKEVDALRKALTGSENAPP